MLINRIYVLFLLIMVAGAFIFFAYNEKTTTHISHAGELLFPEIIDQVDNIQKIDVDIGAEKLVFVKDVDGFWNLENKGFYPASIQRIKDLVLGVSYLKIVEEKTSDPKKFSSLGLTDSAKDRIIISFKDIADNELTGLIVGKRGNDIAYVRKSGQQQTWKVKSNLPLSYQFKDWVKQPILSIGMDEIAKIQLHKQVDQSITIIKDPEADDGFKLADISEDEQNKVSPYEVSDIPYTLTDLYFDDVANIDDITWNKELYGTILTTDGIQLDIEFTSNDEQVYTKLQATAKSAEPSSELLAKVEQINSIAKRFAYKLPTDSYASINKQKQDLLKANL